MTPLGRAMARMAGVRGGGTDTEAEATSGLRGKVMRLWWVMELINSFLASPVLPPTLLRQLGATRRSWPRGGIAFPRRRGSERLMKWRGIRPPPIAIFALGGTIST